MTSATDSPTLAARLLKALTFWNNVLLIPLFTLLVLETTVGGEGLVD